MTITATPIADSINLSGERITTLALVYPRFIHSEFMTHRAFSRNASSSRAIPIQRMIGEVLGNPAMPIEFGRNQPGMQAGHVLNHSDTLKARSIWDTAMRSAVHHALELQGLGVHKQIVNRIIEPYVHIRTLVTATEWQNFFSLRCHVDAQPEIRELACAMRAVMRGTTPLGRITGEAHLPYIEFSDAEAYPIDQLYKISAARCARVSYLNHEGRPPEPEDDLALAERLLDDGHLSPFEHQALSSPDEEHANFKGWLSYRRYFETR